MDDDTEFDAMIQNDTTVLDQRPQTSRTDHEPISSANHTDDQSIHGTRSNLDEPKDIRYVPAEKRISEMGDNVGTRGQTTPMVYNSVLGEEDEESPVLPMLGTKVKVKK